MKQALALSLFILALPLFAQQLGTYQHINAALLQGKMIRIITDFAQCQTQANDVAPIKMVGLFMPNEIIINQHGDIMASMLHFTLKNPKFLNQPVFETVSYTFKTNETVVLETQILDTQYHPIIAPVNFQCALKTGVSVYTK